MKFSESRSYIDHMIFHLDGDYENATRCLLEAMEETSEPMQQAQLLRRLGQVAFDSGALDEALELFEQAEVRDGHSLLSRYLSAKFLGSVGRTADAVEKCDRIISDVASGWRPETDDFSPEAYAKRVSQLRGELLRGQA